MEKARFGIPQEYITAVPRFGLFDAVRQYTEDRQARKETNLFLNTLPEVPAEEIAEHIKKVTETYNLPPHIVARTQGLKTYICTDEQAGQLQYLLMKEQRNHTVRMLTTGLLESVKELDPKDSFRQLIESSTGSPEQRRNARKKMESFEAAHKEKLKQEFNDIGGFFIQRPGLPGTIVLNSNSKDDPSAREHILRHEVIHALAARDGGTGFLRQDYSEVATNTYTNHNEAATELLTVGCDNTEEDYKKLMQVIADNPSYAYKKYMILLLTTLKGYNKYFAKQVGKETFGRQDLADLYFGSKHTTIDDAINVVRSEDLVDDLRMKSTREGNEFLKEIYDTLFNPFRQKIDLQPTRETITPIRRSVDLRKQFAPFTGSSTPDGTLIRSIILSLGEDVGIPVEIVTAPTTDPLFEGASKKFLPFLQNPTEIISTQQGGSHDTTIMAMAWIPDHLIEAYGEDLQERLKNNLIFVVEFPRSPQIFEDLRTRLREEPGYDDAETQQVVDRIPRRFGYYARATVDPENPTELIFSNFLPFEHDPQAETGIISIPNGSDLSQITSGFVPIGALL